MELWQSDATELARLIRTGQASAREAVDSVLARLHKVNPAVNAVVRVLEEEARTVADTADAARARGDALPPLHGVPVTTKVNIDQAGLPTDNGVVRAQGPHRQGGQPGRRQSQARRRHHRRPHQCTGLLHARLHRQRAARPHAQPARSVGDAGRLEWRRGGCDRDRHRRRSPTPTISAARCASRPTATAWSACAPALAASPPSIRVRLTGPADHAVADGGPGPSHTHGARCAARAAGDGARRSARLALERRANGRAAAGASDQGRNRARRPRRPTASRPGSGRAPSRQASAGGWLRRRGNAAARHRARRRTLSRNLCHRRHLAPCGRRCKRWAIPTRLPR